MAVQILLPDETSSAVSPIKTLLCVLLIAVYILTVSAGADHI